MPNALVIVESPTKARKIADYLGDGFVVEASIGHIRDLPRSAADVPAAYKGEPWARLGIDVDNDFKPLYVLDPKKRDHIRYLKALLKDVDELYVATDEDREGEAIAWHILEVLSPPPSVDVKRMVFNEITRDAIQNALLATRELDRRLVDAQEARRMLDRLYGYEVSPVLWKKVMPRLSAGRVQSVATRMVVERERERMAFVSASYWDLTATFAKRGPVAEGDPQSFKATLVQVDGRRLATGKDFGTTGTIGSTEIVALDQTGAVALAAALADTEFAIRSVEPKPYRRRPAAPFITSTLQQEAGRKLRLSSAMAMRTAQSLYEKGYITYMRTDSTTLSETALRAARSLITERYGKAFLPDAPRLYATKSKNAQEAHEAIRPAGEAFRSPEDVAREVPATEARLYEMIWQRTVASQMTDAVGETVQVRVGGLASDGRDAEFAAAGTIITHAGFRRAYVESTDDEADDDERALPALTKGEVVDHEAVEPDGHETQPPPRYTEASLVKRLDDLDIGRPSTYASIMGTIQDRGYVWKKGTALVPTLTAFSVVSLLEQHFPDLVDYAFTKRMEEELDDIATGTLESIPWLSGFYFGANDDPGLKEMVSDRLGEIDARAVNTIPLGVTESGQTVVARIGKYGPYVQRDPGSADRHPDLAPGEPVPADSASIPDDIAPDELTLEVALKYLDSGGDERTLGTDAESGLPVIAKAGRFGPYVQLGEADGDLKPKTSSLFKTMTLETLTLDEALQLLSLPRLVGLHPEDGQEITAQNGRYGPYIKKGSDSRSLETEDQLFSVDLHAAVTIFAQPKLRRGQTPKPPLREMGVDTVSGKPMVVKDGRFGPYVTDGETNASLRKGDTIEELTDERASELLAIRREAAPSTKPKRVAKAKPKKPASTTKRTVKAKTEK